MLWVGIEVEFVVAAAEVLDERVPSSDHSRRPVWVPNSSSTAATCGIVRRSPSGMIADHNQGAPTRVGPQAP